MDQKDLETAKNPSLEEKSRRNILYNPYTALAIIFCSLLMTFGAAYMTNRQVHERARDQFDFQVRELSARIESRLMLYEQALHGAAAMMKSLHRPASRQEWHDYVQMLEINKYWPGIQGIGFSVPVHASEKQAFVDRVRAEGFPEFEIWPEGKRDQYSAIIYLEPFDWRNQRAFGYDMGSNEPRRQAMEKARDTGAPVISGILTLVQETDKDVQKGFLMFCPLYLGTDRDPETVEDRRRFFSGWIYAPFRAGDFMKGLLGSGEQNLDIEIYDGEQIRPETLLYDHDGVMHGSAEKTEKGKYSSRVVINAQGHSWTVYFYSGSWLSEQEKYPARFVALGGLLVNVLLFWVIHLIYSLEQRAFAMARSMTAELSQVKVSLEEKVAERTRELQALTQSLEEKVKSRTLELQERVRELESLNQLMVGREKKMMELKRQIEEISRNSGPGPGFSAGGVPS